MDNFNFPSSSELKPSLEPSTAICRCCLSTKKRMKDAKLFNSHFMDLAGINVTESDGLPQWVCYECSYLLDKSLRFKHKMLKAHSILYEYLTRCAPFPIDAQDPELAKYASAQLCNTSTLTFDTGKGKMGYHKVLQHKKQQNTSELDNVELPLPQVNKTETVKEEDPSFSDYEDNITLEEYRTNVTKLTEEDIKMTEDDLAELLEASENIEKERKRKKVKRREEKGKRERKRRDIIDIQIPQEPTEAIEPKISIRKPLELDPTKIKVVTLNPEEQVRQREEESKANLKFPFQCHLCFKGFNFESKLHNHMSKHSPSRGQFECVLCRMYLPTSYSYSVHSLIHTRRYECMKCGRRMIDRASILDHYRSQHEGLTTLYTCHLCGKISSNSKTHRGHMRNHHSGERPSCDQCGKSFVNKDSLAEHIQIHLGIKNYECGTCGKRFRTRTQIKHHQLKHSETREFYCVECDTRFKSAHSLRQHLLKSLKHKDKGSLKYPCTRCDKRFDTEPRLQHHISIQHDGLRPHRCSHCPATLATASSLHKHVLSVHRGRRPPPSHVCDTCGKAFTGKSVLTNHVRTHTGEKPFECNACGRKFTQRTAMRTHVKLVHLKIRRTAKIKPETILEEPPKLDPYPTAFPKEELVFNSWRQPCDTFDVPPVISKVTSLAGVAGQTFFSQPPVKVFGHVLSVHRGRRPPPSHVCDTCGKAFTGKSVLTNHVRTHTGEKPFECNACGRKFTQRTAMRTHVKLVHLKIRRTAKIKPETILEEPPKLDPYPTAFPKEELVFNSWRQPCDTFDVPPVISKVTSLAGVAGQTFFSQPPV